MTTSAIASINHIPQPWRAEAVVEGREVDYGTDWFMQEFSNYHIEQRPGVTDNGLRATGGSVTSNHLYLDFRLRQELNFTDSLHSVVLDIQRSEDFDGAFDRQLVGLQYGVNERTAFALQGDVFADKSQSDIYFTGRHQIHQQNFQHSLHAALILPNYYFNDKTSGDDRFDDEPMTLFMQWQGTPLQSSGHSTLISLNYTPKTSFDSRSNGLFVESESLRGALSWRLQRKTWWAGLEFDGEKSDRAYQLDSIADVNQPAEDNSAPQNIDFERESFAVTLRYGVNNIDWQPVVGLRYFSLDEQGYFGRRSNQTGQVKRREPLAFFSGTLTLSPRQRLKPTIYLGQARIKQNFSDPEWKSRDETEFIGKISLPWQYVMSAEAGAILTVGLSINLHEAAFGGGNVQMHWPM